MNYKTLVRQHTRDGYMKKVAVDLKNRMRNLRQEVNPADERRWIWELIQNGKDVCSPGVPFKVAINLVGDNKRAVLEFKHNGKPFSVKNITYLVEAVSSKDQEELEYAETGIRPTGKFGSGFLTTHLLSEKVELETVIKAPGLGYKKCNLMLDRSSRDENGILDAMLGSLSILENLDELEDLSDYNPENYNTTFRYHLDAHGIKAAGTGLNDLHQSLAYTLVFVPVIKEVKIEHLGFTYRLRDDLTKVDGDVTFYTIEKDDALFGEEFQGILSILGDRVHIAMPVHSKGEHIFLDALPEDQPRLFCDFPLIGTEDFPFPVILDSPYFDLNDPRSVVRLTDVAEPGIMENKDLIQEAVKLYTRLLSYCSTNNKVQHLFNIASMATSEKRDWLSADWYKSNMSKPVHEALTILPVVDREKGERIPIRSADKKVNITFPSNASEEVRDAIFDLGMMLYPRHLPRRTEIHQWYEVLWPGCYELTVKALAEVIVKAVDITGLQNVLVGGTDAIRWLNSFYDLLNLEESYLTNVIINKIAVLPDQHGTFKLMKDLKFDPGIEEVFKTCLFSLGYDIKKELRLNSVVTNNKLKDQPKEEISHFIYDRDNAYTILNRHLKEASGDIPFKVALQVVTVTAKEGQIPAYREKMYLTALKLYPDAVSKRATVQAYTEKIYEQTDVILLRRMAADIAACSNLERFAVNYGFTDEKMAGKWLADFVVLLTEVGSEQLLDKDSSPILPNQHGVFCSRKKLFSGPGTDEILKDVAAKLGHDYRKDLIDSRMPVTFDDVMIIDNAIIAEKISTLAGVLMTDMRQDEDTQQAFNLLFGWFNNNPKDAASWFGDLYHNRHRLCNSDEIVTSMGKAADLDSLLAENNVDTVDDLRKILQWRNNGANDNILTPITQNILVSLGVKNAEEFKAALQDKNLGELFGHQSVPSPDYFVFAQTLIDRTRAQVRQFLIELGYDFSEADETATTVFAGVRKNGQVIDIVFRPGDNGEVIFYYGSEISTLKNPGVELWVCKESGSPTQLTLGKIIEDNDIKKIRFN